MKIYSVLLLEHFLEECACAALYTDEDYGVGKSELFNLLTIGQEMFSAEPTLLDLDFPINVCGDVHGDLIALVHLLCMGRWPPRGKFLFLGDYVDRGHSGIDVVVLLLSLKLLFPFNIFMTRGNHETQMMNAKYGFRSECYARYSKNIHQEFLLLFDLLPIAAVVQQHLFCVHGGLSAHLETLDAVKKIRRPVKILRGQLLNDLLWADPVNYVCEWKTSARGLTQLFGPQSATSFCRRCQIDMVVRSHQMVQNGYNFNLNHRVITIFGIPLYNQNCNRSAVAFFNVTGNGDTVVGYVKQIRISVDLLRLANDRLMFKYVDDMYRNFVGDISTVGRIASYIVTLKPGIIRNTIKFFKGLKSSKITLGKSVKRQRRHRFRKKKIKKRRVIRNRGKRRSRSV